MTRLWARYKKYHSVIAIQKSTKMMRLKETKRSHYQEFQKVSIGVRFLFDPRVCCEDHEVCV